MKISQLIEELQEEQKLHGDMEVVLVEDDEGNGYRKADFVDSYIIVKDDPDLYPVDDPNDYEKDELDIAVFIWP